MFIYKNQPYTKDDLERSRLAQNYSGTLDQFIQMYKNDGMEELEQKDDYYSDKEFSFGPTVDPYVTNLVARGVNALLLQPVSGIAKEARAFELVASDFYGEYIKGETEEEAVQRRQKIEQEQEEDIYRPSNFLKPVIETVEKGFIESKTGLGITENLEAGNYAEAGRQVTEGFVETIPFLLAAYSGVGTLSALGVGIAGDKFYEEREKDPKKSNAQLFLNAQGTGAIEVGFEIFTSFFSHSCKAISEFNTSFPLCFTIALLKNPLRFLS